MLTKKYGRIDLAVLHHFQSQAGIDSVDKFGDLLGLRLVDHISLGDKANISEGYLRDRFRVGSGMIRALNAIDHRQHGVQLASLREHPLGGDRVHDRNRISKAGGFDQYSGERRHELVADF